jgi:glycosyltransferase involved in cell wall biosynthesis
LRLVIRHRIEVVHWNFCPPLRNGYIWWLTLLAPRVWHYFTDHNSRFLPTVPPVAGLRRAIKRVLLRRYRKVLCVSEFVRDCLREQGTWSNLESCAHFVNAARFRPDPRARAAVRQELGADGRFVCLTVAHLIKAKGIDVLLRALAETPPSVALWVVGEGEEAGRLGDLCRERSLGDRVRFLGLQKDVAPFMQAADCFVCPSLWAEAAGLVNLEAQACGLPVVASRIGGIPEYVDDGRTGLLFPPGDDRQLAAAVRRLCEEPGLCTAMGRDGRAMVFERFSAERRIDAYIDLYRTPV